MPYEVPDLPYDYAALEPHIDEATMRVHHDKHHQAYVDKANAALEGTDWADKSVEEVLQNLDALGDKATPVRLFVLSSRDFRRLVQRSPSVERKVMRSLARRLLELSGDPALG